MPAEWATSVNKYVPSSLSHWSRRFEYPWTIEKGLFQKDEWVLDAAGGDGPLQNLVSQIGCKVVNIDIESKYFCKTRKNYQVQGDLRKLCFADNSFNKVMCISVLEHILEPEKIIPELWRVLKPGGRLIVTMDIANYVRYNHTIDMEVASKILQLLDMSMPDENPNYLRYCIAEHEPKEDEPKQVILKVLCFYVDKPH